VRPKGNFLADGRWCERMSMVAAGRRVVGWLHRTERVGWLETPSIETKNAGNSLKIGVDRAACLFQQ
jgi:hypothetical protein